MLLLEIFGEPQMEMELPAKGENNKKEEKQKKLAEDIKLAIDLATDTMIQVSRT